MNICRDFLLVATILFYIYQGRKRERDKERYIYYIAMCMFMFTSLSIYLVVNTLLYACVCSKAV